MPTLLKDAQLRSVQSATPQSQAWGLFPLLSMSSAVDETTARSVLGDAETASKSAALDTVSLSAQSRGVMPDETPSTNGVSELLPLAALEAPSLSAQTTDVMPSQMPSRNVHIEQVPFAAKDTFGVPAQATDNMPAWMPSSTVHDELSQHADELDSAAPLLDDSQPNSFQLPPGVVWTQNDSFDHPNSDLQQEIVQNNASGSDVNHTD